MPICPIHLMFQSNGVYYYQAVDCSNPISSVPVTSDHPLQCGCDGNPDCQGQAGGGGPTNPLESTVSLSAAVRHVCAARLQKNGLRQRLAHDAGWDWPSVEVHPEYAGERSYHVVKHNGRERTLRLLRATYTPASCLYVKHKVGRSSRFVRLPSVDLWVGQECSIPGSVTPLPTVTHGRTKTGSCCVTVRREGKKAKEAGEVFHVLLAGDQAEA